MTTEERDELLHAATKDMPTVKRFLKEVFVKTVSRADYNEQMADEAAELVWDAMQRYRERHKKT